MSRAITGDLSIVTSSGTVLTDSTDLGLAWKWAEAENGAEWATMTRANQWASVGAALTALREAFENGCRV